MNRVRLQIAANQVLIDEVRSLLPETLYDIQPIERTQAPQDHPEALLVEGVAQDLTEDLRKLTQSSEAFGVPVIYLLDESDQPGVQQVSVITPFWYVFKPLRQRELVAVLGMARQQPFAIKKKPGKSKPENNDLIAYVGFGKATAEPTFHKFAQHSPEFICIISMDPFAVDYANAAKGLGYDFKKIAAQPRYLAKLVHPQDWVSVEQTIWQLQQANAPENGQEQFRIQRKDGQWEWLVARWTILRQSVEGVPQQLLLSFATVTELHKTREAYQLSQTNLQALIENTYDGIWAICQNFRIIAMNSSFAQHYKLLYGFDLEVGDLITAKSPADVVDYWKTQYERAFSGERFSEEISYEDVNQGKTFYYDVSFNPIVSESGNVEGATMFARNVTRQKKSERELLQANFELDSFVYRASHDLRAPLRSILGLVALSHVEQDALQRNNYLGLIEKSTHKLDSFIVDLTNISRNKRAELEIDVVDFESIIEECAENLRYMANADRVTLKTDISIQSDFYSDASRMAIIFQNILSNAVKYQNLQITDAFLHIGITADQKRAVVTFTDNGQGIHAASLDKIFDMFFRASDHAYGSGLGLYITRQVAERLKGSIYVRSDVGKGTEFTLTLPNLTDSR